MRLISSARAYAIASQWGSFRDNSDPGRCLYGFHYQDGRPVSDQHRSDCLTYLCRIMAQGGPGSMSARSERDLRSLIRFLANCPIRPSAPAMVPQQVQQQQGCAGTADPDYPRALAYERTREIGEGELTYETPDVLTACVGRALAIGWSFDQVAAEAGEWPWFLHMTFDEGRCVRRAGGWRLYVETAAEALAEAGEADHVALITAGPAA